MGDGGPVIVFAPLKHSMFLRVHFRDSGLFLPLTLNQACGERYFSPSKQAGAIGWANEKVYNLFIFFILLFML